MSRRARAVTFLSVSICCALLAATLAGGYVSRAERRYGPLVSVLVADADLAAGRKIGPRRAGRLLVRRVPARFVPPGALASPEEAAGQVPAAAIPAGSYVLAAQLQPPRSEESSEPRPARGKVPVDIPVAGADLAASLPPGSRVDVVVTEESRGDGPGRTFVAAEDVELLDLRAGDEAEGFEEREDASLSPAGWTATLALGRRQAVRLIGIGSYAREVRLLPRGWGVKR